MWKEYQLDLYQFHHQHHLMALDQTKSLPLAIGYVAAMSRFLLNIEKRSLPWFTLSGVGLASKNAM